jgi:hypothetical protein
MIIPDKCERCGKLTEKDGICALDGKWWGLWWLCDACIELDLDHQETEEAD